MSKKGYTLTELLIAIGVVAVVLAGSAVAINMARSKQRDAVRISHVRQMQTALENYFSETSSYPVGDSLPLGDATVSACLSTSGFLADCIGEEAVILRTVMSTVNAGLDEKVQCGTPLRNAFCYGPVENGQNYQIEFELENSWAQAGLIKGINCAQADGIEAGPCR